MSLLHATQYVVCTFSHANTHAHEIGRRRRGKKYKIFILLFYFLYSFILLFSSTTLFGVYDAMRCFPFCKRRSVLNVGCYVIVDSCCCCCCYRLLLLLLSCFFQVLHCASGNVVYILIHSWKTFWIREFPKIMRYCCYNSHRYTYRNFKMSHSHSHFLLLVLC